MDLKNKIKEIKKCNEFESAATLLSEIDFMQLSSRHFTSLGRYLEQMNEAPDIKIAYLSNFVIDMLPAYVSVYAARERIRSGAYVGAYNQYFQEILNEESGLLENDPDVIFLSFAMKHLEPEIFFSFSSLSVDRKKELLEKIIENIRKWIQLSTEKVKASLLINNFPYPGFTQSGIADMNNPFGEMRFYQELNAGLAELVSENSRVHVLDVAKLSARYGSNNVHDPKMYYLAKIMWREGFLAVVAEEILRFIIGLKGIARKCLVLDLDNTLWGGIVGEDGVLGIKVGQGDPVSEAFYDFQYKIKTLKDRGVMLAICSKNNRDDVIEAFENRSDMPLRLTDFSAMKVNWESKHLNIQKLAAELNIGLDSMIFVDDNPAECSLIRQMLPQVKTIQVPPNPEDMPTIIDKLVDFEKIVILEDDIKKTAQYRQIKQRKELQESVGDLRAYLQSLGTEIHIRMPVKEDLSRVHQLFTKTNQFNTTTIRYDMGEIERQFNDKAFELFTISARDTFGDLGIIGLYLIELFPPKARIDSFILSCRAMGRGIESAIMNYLKNRYFNEKDIVLIEACYRPTKKNIPVQDFFPQQGFELIDQNEKGKKIYQLASAKWSPVDCSWIKAVEDEG